MNTTTHEAAELPLPATAIVAGLFDDLIAALDEAVVCIAERRIEDRFHALAAATEIVGDLAAGLDEQAQDDWSRRTEALYKYVIRLIMAANLRNNEAPIAEAKMLLEPVRRAWQCLAAEEKMRGELARRGVETQNSSLARWFESAAAE